MASSASHDSARRKIGSIEQLAAEIAARQAEGKRVIHCHGVFDPMHIGHIRHFAAAKSLGDLLVVTVTPDRFVNKGPHRPVFPDELRAEAIAALETVDYVGINLWPTAIETIQTLRPNVFVKGSEFRGGKDLTGAIKLEEEAIVSVGGKLEFTDDVTFSASHLVNRHLSVFPQEVSDYLADFSQRTSTGEILKFLDQARKLKVLVVGETVIDDYQYVEAIGKSSKEPTLVVKSLNNDRFVGGAAAVANHVAGFCDNVTLHSILGEINSEEDFIRSRLKPHIDAGFLIRERSPTIVKRRFIEQYFYSKLFEVYELNDERPTIAESQAWTSAIAGRLNQFDVVIVIDSGHGFLTREMIDLLCRESRFLAVNTQANAGNQGYHVISNYPRADYICIAENEMRLESRDRRSDLKPMMEDVSRRLNCPRVVVTRGKKGCCTYQQDVGHVDVPAFASNVVDRIGAGDAFLSITSLCAAQNAPMEVLGFIGNVVGAQAVATVGNQSPIERIPLSRHIEHLLK
ncbi:PfkB family carbohydrate kinase [Schlesneria sp. T3-172]|uniref:PfkB family carbohydrate kinase n=1 Tax=Schlesneria sphaerica TaxID=3373610 RepID=UPI0037CB6791